MEHGTGDRQLDGGNVSVKVPRRDGIPDLGEGGLPDPWVVGIGHWCALVSCTLTANTSHILYVFLHLPSVNSCLAVPSAIEELRAGGQAHCASHFAPDLTWPQTAHEDRVPFSRPVLRIERGVFHEGGPAVRQRAQDRLAPRATNRSRELQGKAGCWRAIGSKPQCIGR